MKQLKIFLFLTLLGLQSFAQTLSPNVSPTSGGYATGNNGVSLSWTMGQTFSATLSGGGRVLSQGEQQPEIDLFTGSTATLVCAGSPFSVPYVAKGYVDAANVFTAQLSNANGSFATPVNIGTATATLSGNINATIPPGTAAGTGYRVRVVSGNPARVAADNGFNFAVNTLSTAPTSITSSASSVLYGQNFTMTVTGGSLGSGAAWKWYAGSIGGTSIGTGASITTSQTGTSTYFVRAEGPCGNSNAASKTISIIYGPATITTTAVNNTICSGASVKLTVAGALCSGAIWKWTKGSCNPNQSENNLGTGQTLVVAPTSTTTYYVKSQGGTCATTNCIAVTITVLPLPLKPGSITGLSSVCKNGTNYQFSVPAESGYSFNWSFPAGCSITQGAGTNLVKVTWGTNSGTVGVTKSNLCGVSTASTKAVTATVCANVAARNDVTAVVTVSGIGSVKIAPNPATSFVYVKLYGYIGAVTLQLRGIEGRVLRQEKIQAASVKFEQRRIDVANLTSGTYLLMIIDEKGHIHTEKVIIAR